MCARNHVYSEKHIKFSSILYIEIPIVVRIKLPIDSFKIGELAFDNCCDARVVKTRKIRKTFFNPSTGSHLVILYDINRAAGVKLHSFGWILAACGNVWHLFVQKYDFWKVISQWSSTSLSARRYSYQLFCTCMQARMSFRDRWSKIITISSFGSMSLYFHLNLNQSTCPALSCLASDFLIDEISLSWNLIMI